MVNSKEGRQQLKQGRLGNNSCKSRNSDTRKMQIEAQKNLAVLPSPSIMDMIKEYNGDKYKLAYDLTRKELGTEGDIPTYQKTYKNNLRNINRYIKKERSPNKEVQEKFRELYIPESSRNLYVYIRGCVRVSNEYYYKDTTWKTPIVIPSNEVKEFLSLASQDNEIGYRYLNRVYSGNSTLNADDLTWLDNTEIDMTFEKRGN